jgi:hypothetical protein
MSDPLSAVCAYCGSPDVLDDAWFCDTPACWAAYEADCREEIAYQARTPLTHDKARGDLMATKAAVWGIPVIRMDDAAARLHARVYPPTHP